MLDIFLRLDSKLTHCELLTKAQQLHRDNSIAYEELARNDNKPEVKDAWVNMIGTNLSRIGYINEKLGYFVNE